LLHGAGWAHLHQVTLVHNGSLLLLLLLLLSIVPFRGALGTLLV
jgi:hypothetical protein